uniref:Uncharacterized protein n=1 Tax=Biomphalaria glabrata TaxID=6526 RepID=A0A2C9L8Q2_BIOGL
MLDQNSYIKKYQENMTPLMAACLNRSFKTLTLLLEAQADVNAKDGYQDTSLIYLCREKYVVNAQEDEDKNNQTLKIPKFCLDQLISKGADINVKGRDGMTALMHCARNGNSTFIQVLEANNVNMKLQCNEGRTALIYATQYQSEECVSCIYYLINNSDVNARDAEGDTALMHSIKYKNERVFMFLVKKSDINIQNNQRMTALMLAVQTEEKKYVAELLNHGPLLNLQNKDGDTALILATRNGEENKKDIFKLLCEAKGIELNTQNKQGETALIVAARNLNKTFVEDLISKGAHRFMTDKDRKSALDHATQSKSELKGDTEIGEQIMEMLKKKKINK